MVGLRGGSQFHAGLGGPSFHAERGGVPVSRRAGGGAALMVDAMLLWPIHWLCCVESLSVCLWPMFVTCAFGLCVWFVLVCGCAYVRGL